MNHTPVAFESEGVFADWASASSSSSMIIADPPLSLWDYDPTSGEANGVNSHPLREVTDFIASHIATLPLKLYKRLPNGGRERVRDHPLAHLLLDPTGNPAITSSMFWQSLIMDGLLADRFLALIVDSEQYPGVKYLKRIPPKKWSTSKNFYDEIDGVKITDANGDVHKISVNGPIIVQVGYSYSGAKGSPKRARLKAVLDEYQASIEYRKSVNEHGLQAPLIIERDKPWPNVESQTRFQRSMSAFIRGGASTGGGIVLEDGMKATQLNTFKPIDVNDLDARDRVKIDVANAYGIPPELLGIREGNFSNLEAFKQMLYGTYLDPYIVTFEQTLNACLRDRLQASDTGLYIEFDRDAQLRGDPVAQYQTLVTSTGRPFMTTNEARGTLNMPYVDGGDELVTPLNVLVGGQTSPQDGITEGRSVGSMEGITP